MTYDVLKTKSHRSPVQILEIDFNVCSNDYGLAPCAAVLPGSGLQCFKTRKTCQDILNFTTSTKTLKFSNVPLPELTVQGEAPVFPVIKSVTTAPSVITPSGGLGVRATASIKLDDFKWSDVGIDDDKANRTYKALDQGTFFGRLLSREPFYEGNQVRLKQGYLDETGSFNEANFMTRHYIIYRIEGPGPSGNVTIQCKDPLRFADNAKAQFPARFNEVRLAQDVTASGTESIVIADPDDEFKNTIAGGSAPFYMRIGDEVISFTAGGGPGGGNFTASGITRGGVAGSVPSFYTGVGESEEHEIGDAVVLCYLFDSVNISDAMKTLLIDGAGIDAGFIDDTQWETIISNGFDNYTVDCLLTEPEGVKDLLNELTEYNIYIFWNERTNKFELSSILENVWNGSTYNEDQHILKNSIKQTKDTKRRISQAWLHIGLRHPSLEIDKAKNYDVIRARQDLGSETDYGTKAVKNIFSRWFQKGSTAIGDEIVQRLVNEYKDTKTVITLSLDAKDDSQWTGDYVKVLTRQITDEYGAQKETSFLITQVQEKLKAAGVVYNYALESTEKTIGRQGLIAPDEDPENPGNPFPDYADASDALKAKYAFIAPDSGFFDDGTEAYIIR